MIRLYKYTDKEIKELVDSMVVLIDTREHEGKNTHITDWFDKKKISWKKKALDKCDYSFYLPANEKLGIPKDIYFDREVAIERKANLEEISGNLTQSRDRFEHELSLAPKHKVLLIENADFSDIVEGNYDTGYNKQSFMASLFSFWHRYSVPIFFMPDKKYSGLFIKMYFTYYLKNYLR